jgi:hypothetical protein
VQDPAKDEDNGGLSHGVPQREFYNWGFEEANLYDEEYDWVLRVVIRWIASL